ncbi:MAG TPA: ester cyclase [Chloroflexota bacterium]|jgi:steroid delta-isomerase-like uncharacterized protein
MTLADAHVESAALTDTEQRNLEAVTDVLAFWNTQNVAGVLAYYNDDITWRNVALEEIYEGKEQVEEFLVRLFTAFPDLRFSVTDKIVRGNTVAERWIMQGTHLGPFMGVPPTGRAVEIAGMSMVEMRDGKFARDNFYFDSGIVLRQVGLLPPLALASTSVGKLALWMAVKRARVAGIAGGVAVLGLVLTRLLRRARSRSSADST